VRVAGQHPVFASHHESTAHWVLAPALVFHRQWLPNGIKEEMQHLPIVLVTTFLNETWSNENAFYFTCCATMQSFPQKKKKKKKESQGRCDWAQGGEGTVWRPEVFSDCHGCVLLWPGQWSVLLNEAIWTSSGESYQLPSWTTMFSKDEMPPRNLTESTVSLLWIFGICI
jgi:hypothetical protein